MKRIILVLLILIVSTSRGADSFAQAIDVRELVFPRDHASHAGFQTEWWYFTGNLKTESGREFGYQFTIFRRALDPQSALKRGRTSRWAADDFYMGHLAISDLNSKTFYFKEELHRGVLDIAGATDASQISDHNPPRVWMGTWEMKCEQNLWTVRATSGEISVEFKLDQQRAPVLHGKPGEAGLSRKGPNAGQASYYYSLIGLKTTGSISIGAEKHAIASGLSWMDHEYGSNQLSSGQTGWDWLSMQFDDGSALMIYLLRLEDGKLEPASSGTWVDAAGKAHHLELSDIKTTRGRTWTSPKSGGQYALGWTIEIPRFNVKLEVDAAQDDQEINAERMGKISYYEGAIRVRGTVAGKSIRGGGYLEITGASGNRGLGGKL